MPRLYELTSRLLGATAVALLVISVLLVPQGRAIADDGGGGGGAAACNPNTCDASSDCFLAINCMPAGPDWCTHTTDLPNCGDCRCVDFLGFGCQCRP